MTGICKRAIDCIMLPDAWSTKPMISSQLKTAEHELGAGHLEVCVCVLIPVLRISFCIWKWKALWNFCLCGCNIENQIVVCCVASVIVIRTVKIVFLSVQIRFLYQIYSDNAKSYTSTLQVYYCWYKSILRYCMSIDWRLAIAFSNCNGPSFATTPSRDIFSIHLANLGILKRRSKLTTSLILTPKTFKFFSNFISSINSRLTKVVSSTYSISIFTKLDITLRLWRVRTPLSAKYLNWINFL